MSNIKKAFAAARKSAGRELAVFAVMIVLALICVMIALPIMWVMSMLPDWTWWIWSAVFVVWLIFGDTIAVAVRTLRDDRP